MQRRCSHSFNPYRVFKFAATCWYHSNAEFRSSGFQSLSGFQVRCNGRYWQSKGFRIFVVSIPIGFSSSLQPLRTTLYLSRNWLFQSLSGFQVRCNSLWSRSVCTSWRCFNPYRVFKFAATASFIVPRMLWVALVSIPIGFSSSLQLCRASQRQHRHRVVSIPIGFSSSLQRPSFSAITKLWQWFQSLSGFQVRCNAEHHKGNIATEWFQSLSGFQVRCNLWSQALAAREIGGFNPYRVFKFAATT